jgi:hypothetical protein
MPLMAYLLLNIWIFSIILKYCMSPCQLKVLLTMLPMGREPNEKKYPVQSSSALVGVGSLCVAEDLDSY